MKKSLITITASLAVTVTILGMAVPITDAAGAADEPSSPLNVEFIHSPPDDADAADEADEADEADGQEVEAGVPALPGAVEETHTAVSNLGEVPAFVFLEVATPVVRAEDVVLERGVETRPDGWIPVLAYDPQPPWVLIEEDLSDGVLRSVYCYGELEVLHPGETTAPLFESWTLINCRVDGSAMTTGSMDWWEIAELATKAQVICHSVQTELGPNLTAAAVWEMAR